MIPSRSDEEAKDFNATALAAQAAAKRAVERMKAAGSLKKAIQRPSFIGDPEFQGKGLGTDAARVRAKYLFETLNMHRVYSAYLGDNERSRRMQERIGAVETGRFPERYFRDGKYLDEVIMTLTREAWLANLK